MSITVSTETNATHPSVTAPPTNVVAKEAPKHDAEKACKDAKSACEKLNNVTRKDHHPKLLKVATLNVGDGRASLNNNSKLTVGAKKGVGTDAMFSIVEAHHVMPGERPIVAELAGSTPYVSPQSGPMIPSQSGPMSPSQVFESAQAISLEPVSLPMKHLQLRVFDVNSFNRKDPSYIEVLYPDGTLKKFDLKKGHSIFNLEVPVGYQIHAHSGLTSEKAQKSGDVRDNFRVDILEGESSKPKQTPKAAVNPQPAKKAA